jgi:hypothetical protein
MWAESLIRLRKTPHERYAVYRGSDRSADDTVTADSSVLGKVGRVTGRVAHGSVGEVMVGVRGGSEAFFAYPYDAGETFDVGDRVVVVEYDPPRTVLISRFE